MYEAPYVNTIRSLKIMINEYSEVFFLYWYDVGSSWLMETQKSLKTQNWTPQPIQLGCCQRGKKGCYSLNMEHNQSFSDVIQPNNAIRIFR